MCARELKIRIDKVGDRAYPSGSKYITLRVNEWDLVSTVTAILRQKYSDGVKYDSLRYFDVPILECQSDLRMHDIAAAFHADLVRLSVELTPPRFRISLNVKTLSGKTVLFQGFPSDTIYDVKTMIYDREGIPVHQQRLLCASKQMEDTRTLLDCSIKGVSVLHLVVNLRGGGRCRFTDVSSDNHLHVLPWDPLAPEWCVTSAGLNLEGICRNANCAAYNQTVVCERGFGVTNVCRVRCHCPICQTSFVPTTSGFTKCEWLADGLKSNGTPVNLAWKPVGDAYQLFDAEVNIIDWEVLTIVCRRPKPAPTQDLRLHTAVSGLCHAARMCVLCTQRTADTALVPCKHTLCSTCALYETYCPRCFAPIVSTLPVRRGTPKDRDWEMV
jgi:small subunit ribosomal protein S27Ae